MHKQHIQNNFNKVAPNYLTNTNIQKITGLNIANLITKQNIKCDSDCRMLDLGSGPGSLLHTNLTMSNMVLYDISIAMLKQGINQQQNNRVVGDAITLPFADNSFDYVISNLMLQWVIDKNLVFNELYRILKPQGKIILTVLVKPSLWQLQQVWQEIDGNSHTLNFITDDELKSLVFQNNLTITEITNTEHIMQFNSYNNIMKHFKNSGTSITKQHSKGLYTKNTINKVHELYNTKFGLNGCLPLSYHYLAVVMNKGL